MRRSRIHAHHLSLVILLLSLLVMVPACKHGNKNKRDEPATGTAAAGTAAAGSATGKERGRPGKGVVTFSAAGKTLRVRVEVVRTADGLARGLMYRKQLPQMAGMLFIFPTTTIQTFWMKNTYIPLDMIFVDDATMKVVGVVENAEPMTTTQRSVDTESRYVVEVNAGFAKRHKITVGTPMTYEELEKGTL